jgi:hypothetical protein
MSSDWLLDRIRAANPAPLTTITDDELFARIVATPGDARLAARRRRRRRRIGARGVALIAAAVVLSAAGGTGAVELLTHVSPKVLFEANPAGNFGRLPGRKPVRQVVNPQTVRRAATFTVPGVGKFEYWIALSKPSGWLCDAIRQPDGTWADLDGDRYQLGGPVPGCGTLPWHDMHGFAYDQSSLPAPGRRTWQIVYGYAPATGHPAQIRDKVSGATAPIGDGRYFAIVMPLCQGAACGRISPPGYQLQTIDAAGRVLVTDAYDPGE